MWSVSPFLSVRLGELIFHHFVPAIRLSVHPSSISFLFCVHTTTVSMRAWWRARWMFEPWTVNCVFYNYPEGTQRYFTLCINACLLTSFYFAFITLLAKRVFSMLRFLFWVFGASGAAGWYMSNLGRRKPQSLFSFKLSVKSRSCWAASHQFQLVLNIRRCLGLSLSGCKGQMNWGSETLLTLLKT